MKGCRICQASGKQKCMFCGWAPPKRKTDLPMIEQIRMDRIEEEWAWMRKTRAELEALSMASTGSFETDERIREHVGDWGELARGTIIARDGDNYGVRLDSGNDLTISANNRDIEIGGRVTVRFLNGEAKL